MNIIFVLPAITRKISGGYKMVYEYANRLEAYGYNVKIIYDCSYDKIVNQKKIFLIYLYRKFICMQEPRWFTLNKSIKKKVVFSLKPRYFNEKAIIVATAVNTAMDLHNLALKNQKQIYFIQDYEAWNLNEAELLLTYKYDMKKIVVSKWLQNIVFEKAGERSCYIPNGIDTNRFYLVNDVDSMDRKYITFLYHKSERKGCKYAMEVIKRLHRIDCRIQFLMFGGIPRGDEIPDYVTYVEKADENQLLKIYNETQIFVCTSLVEGFGLTGAESMACGCALVTTKTNGTDEYAIDNFNALISEPKDTDSMVKNIVYLLENESERKRLANNAYVSIRKFSWDCSINNFIKLIEE